MPEAWTKKRERQYQHIKTSARDKGWTEEKAGEIAARTVNKQRRLAGETESRRTSGTGNPTQALSKRKKNELYNLAKQYNISGRSRMTKNELIAAIRERQ